MKWLVLIILLVSCRQEDIIPNTCGVNNPLNDLPWLKKLNHDDHLGFSIVQGVYQGQTVYVVSGCGRCFAGPYMSLYRCDGSLICNGLVLDTSAKGCSQIVLTVQDRRTLVEYAP